jgi:hypothetical protein
MTCQYPRRRAYTEHNNFRQVLECVALCAAFNRRKNKRAPANPPKFWTIRSVNFETN